MVNKSMDSKLLTTIGTMVGIIIGSAGMWFTLKDRMSKEIEERVTYRLKTETKIAKIEERLESYKTDIWVLRGKVDALEKK